MTDGEPRRTTTGGTRVIRVSRLAGLALAIPVLLALGIATVAMFVIAVFALLLAPRVRRREWEATESQTDEDGRTITLDPATYRTVAGNTRDRSLLPALPPGRRARE